MSMHKIHVKTNPSYGLQSIPKLLEFAHSGKMMGKGIVVVDEDAVAKERVSLEI